MKELTQRPERRWTFRLQIYFHYFNAPNVQYIFKEYVLNKLYTANVDFGPWSKIQTEERQIDRGCDFNFEDANVQ